MLSEAAIAGKATAARLRAGGSVHRVGLAVRLPGKQPGDPGAGWRWVGGFRVCKTKRCEVPDDVDVLMPLNWTRITVKTVSPMPAHFPVQNNSAPTKRRRRSCVSSKRPRVPLALGAHPSARFIAGRVARRGRGKVPGGRPSHPTQGPLRG